MIVAGWIRDEIGKIEPATYTCSRLSGAGRDGHVKLAGSSEPLSLQVLIVDDAIALRLDRTSTDKQTYEMKSVRRLKESRKTLSVAVGARSKAASKSGRRSAVYFFEYKRFRKVVKVGPGVIASAR